MKWIVRFLKLAVLTAGVLTFGWIALVLVAAAVVLFLLLSAESAFWGGILGD